MWPHLPCNFVTLFGEITQALIGFGCDIYAIDNRGHRPEWCKRHKLQDIALCM